jgi:hypothetical protein
MSFSLVPPGSTGASSGNSPGAQIIILILYQSYIYTFVNKNNGKKDYLGKYIH